MASILAISEKVGQASQAEVIGTNSATVAVGDLVSVTSGFAVKATTTGAIVGSALAAKTFTSDNQTVAKATLPFRVFNNGTLIQLTASAASLANADIGSFFNLTSGQLVDYATKSATAQIVNTSDAGSATDAVVTKQLKLEKIDSTTVGWFSVVTKGNF
jgi:hypothetical protein